MTMSPKFLLLLASGLLGACSTNGYCLRSQPYEKASSIPPLVGTDALKIPDSTTAMRVPEQTGESLPYGIRVADPQKPGRKLIRCLDQPPAFTPAPVDTEPKPTS